jgi:hypothetical protein
MYGLTVAGHTTSVVICGVLVSSCKYILLDIISYFLFLSISRSVNFAKLSHGIVLHSVSK